MKNVVVVGSQWGDEGKGKIVDWLSSEADVVVRFQGGHNAGHTLVIDEKVFIIRPGREQAGLADRIRQPEPAQALGVCQRCGPGRP